MVAFLELHDGAGSAEGSDSDQAWLAGLPKASSLGQKLPQPLCVRAATAATSLATLAYVAVVCGAARRLAVPLPGEAAATPLSLAAVASINWTLELGGELPPQGGACERGEELFYGACYKTCGRLTMGERRIRGGPWTCCASEPCGARDGQDKLGGACRGYDVSGAGACPHSPARQCSSESELYSGVCYKACGVLTSGAYPRRVAVATCCTDDGVECLPINETANHAWLQAGHAGHVTRGPPRLMRRNLLFGWKSAVAALDAVWNSDADIRAWVSKRGYPFEVHSATTEDGVLLRLFRLPRFGAPVVHLQHGILDSAWAWVFNEQFKALGLQLFDAGYDVWLGNNRGTSFSKRWADGSNAGLAHAFWNFSFDDMARYDVPAMIDCVLRVTSQRNLAWVAHSQGTTQFLIAASDAKLQRILASRVSVFVALSPVAWTGHSTSLLRPLLAPSLLTLFRKVFPHGFLCGRSWREAAHLACMATSGTICDISIDLVCGSGPLDHTDNIEQFSKYFPFGTSVKDVEHFSQGMTRNTFRRFDYGLAGNLRTYAQREPPEYNLSRLAVPTALFVAEDDALANRKDVDHLVQVLRPMGYLRFFRRYKNFTHVTWTLGAAEAGFYVADVLSVLREYHANGSSRTGVGVS